MHPKRKRRLVLAPYEPAETGSIGHAIWLCLGGEEGMQGAAELFGLPPNQLNDVIYSRITITKGWLADKNIRPLLEKHRPHSWNEHREAYDAAFAEVPDRTAEPADKDGLGHLLWRVTDARFKWSGVLALELNCAQYVLQTIFNGSARLTKSDVQNWGLRQLLTEKYPAFNQWEQDAFDEIAAALPDERPARQRQRRATIHHPSLS